MKMTSTVRVTSAEGGCCSFIKEFLKYTPIVKIDNLSGYNCKLSQETVDVLRDAIPQMVNLFEKHYFIIDDDYDFLVIEIDNCKSFVPLNEIIWDCINHCEHYVMVMELVEYVQSIISAAHRKIIGMFNSYLIYRTSDIDAVNKDLHAIALLILNLRKFSSLFDQAGIRSDDHYVFYQNICRIFSECILIESEGKITKFSMSFMERSPALVPKVFDEYKIITIHNSLDQGLNFELTGKNIRSIVHTERTLYEYLGYISKTFVDTKPEVTEMCSEEFMSNIYSVSVPPFARNERCIWNWMSLVQKCYKFVFDAICRKLRDNGAAKSTMIIKSTEHDITTLIRDIRTIVSSIDVNKLPIQPHVTQESLYAIVSDNIIYKMPNGELMHFTIPPHGSLTKRAQRDDD